MSGPTIARRPLSDDGCIGIVGVELPKIVILLAVALLLLAVLVHLGVWGMKKVRTDRRWEKRKTRCQRRAETEDL